MDIKLGYLNLKLIISVKKLNTEQSYPLLSRVNVIVCETGGKSFDVVICEYMT